MSPTSWGTWGSSGKRRINVDDLSQAELSRLVEALLEALPHVRRQQHGRHEQDRADAEEWLAKWEPLIRELRS